MPDGTHITEEENALDSPVKLEFIRMDPDLFDSEENLLDIAVMFCKHVFPDVIGMTVVLFVPILRHAFTLHFHCLFEPLSYHFMMIMTLTLTLIGLSKNATYF